MLAFSCSSGVSEAELQSSDGGLDAIVDQTLEIEATVDSAVNEMEMMSDSLDV